MMYCVEKDVVDGRRYELGCGFGQGYSCVVLALTQISAVMTKMKIAQGS